MHLNVQEHEENKMTRLHVRKSSKTSLATSSPSTLRVDNLSPKLDQSIFFILCVFFVSSLKHLMSEQFQSLHLS